MKSDGIILLNKPKGWTSREAVDFVDKVVGSRRVGHAGTLDPLATGLLVICVGKATRLGQFLLGASKEYRAGFLLGRTSPTDDIEGPLTEIPVAQPPRLEEVSACLQSFVGTVEQRPPVYSAIKISGRRAYQLAREGLPIELPARKVEIRAIRLLRYDFPHLEVEIECGGGTYVRAIGRDLGEKLGCGAVMESLVRTRVGPFHLEFAVTPEELQAGDVSRHLKAMEEAVAHLPRVTLADSLVRRILHGQPVRLQRTETVWPIGTDVAVFDSGGQLVGVARVTHNGQLKPKVNLGSPT